MELKAKKTDYSKSSYAVNTKKGTYSIIKCCGDGPAVWQVAGPGIGRNRPCEHPTKKACMNLIEGLLSGDVPWVTRKWN